MPEKPGIEALPAAGYERREELKRRADELMAEAEFVMQQLEIEGIDPAKFDPKKVDREIRQAVNDVCEVYVSNMDPHFRYAWMYRDPYNRYGGRAVRSLQALGWEVVRGDMKEAVEHKAVTGERWVADCLLMRCRLDHYAKLQFIDRERRLRQQEGVTATFQSIADRYGIPIQTELPKHIVDHFETQATLRRPSRSPTRRIPPQAYLRQAAARQLALDKLSREIKTGTVEGLDVPGSTRR